MARRAETNSDQKVPVVRVTAFASKPPAKEGGSRWWRPGEDQGQVRANVKGTLGIPDLPIQSDRSLGRDHVQPNEAEGAAPKQRRQFSMDNS
jgi:hypothetical protein